MTTRKRTSYEFFPIFSEVCFAHDSPRMEFTLVGTSVDTADIFGNETALERNRSGGVVGRVSCYESEVPRIQSQWRMTWCCTHTVNIFLILKLRNTYHKVHRMLHGYWIPTRFFICWNSTTISHNHLGSWLWSEFWLPFPCCPAPLQGP